MFERRPVWAALIGFSVCISIWRISVQEPSMLAEYDVSGNVGGVIANAPPQPAALYQSLDGAKHFLGRKVNDISEEGRAARPPSTDSESSTDKTHTATQTNVIQSSARRRFKLRLAAESGSKFAAKTFKNVQKRAQQTHKTNSSNIYDSHYGKISGKRGLISGQQQASSSSSWFVEWDSLNAEQQRRQFSSRLLSSENSTSSLTAAAVKAKAIPFSSTSTESTSPRLPANDFQQLIDLHNFDYIMRQPVCSADVDAVILVHSAPANRRKRLLLRETWAQRSLLRGSPLRLMFLLGAVSNQTLQQQLWQENNEFADMLQGNFVDDYKNMTYKHVMAFKWFIYNCAQAQLLLKVDDDVFVNTPQLLRYAQMSSQAFEEPQMYSYSSQIALSPARHNQSSKRTPPPPLFRRPQRLMFCQPMFGARVKRSFRSKWRVSTHEYAARFYPPYCPGYSIAYSADVVRQLYSSAQAHKYFWIDDVHVTGTLAQLNDITISSALPFVLNSDTYERVMAGQTDLDELEFLFAWPGITEQQIRALWQLIELRYDGNRTT